MQWQSWLFRFLNQSNCVIFHISVLISELKATIRIFLVNVYNILLPAAAELSIVLKQNRTMAKVESTNATNFIQITKSCWSINKLCKNIFLVQKINWTWDVQTICHARIPFFKDKQYFRKGTYLVLPVI